MLKKAKKPILITVAVILNILLSIFCIRIAFFATTKILFGPPSGERAETATDLPSYDEKATDVRVTSIPRTERLNALVGILFGEGEVNITEQETPCIQILYGYKVDGVWIDIPAENYPLFYYENGSDLIVAGCPSHITKVGNHALICIVDPCEGTVPYDTLGTVPLTPFRELLEAEAEGIEYGLILDDRERILRWNEPAYTLSYGDMNRYYFLLNLDELPDDYELHYVTYEYSQETKEFYTEYTITAEDIWRYMELAEEQINSQ